MLNLTATELGFMFYLSEYLDTYQVMPTMAEIQRVLSFTNSRSVVKFIEKLIDKGYLTRAPNTNRNLRFVFETNLVYKPKYIKHYGI